MAAFSLVTLVFAVSSFLQVSGSDGTPKPCLCSLCIGAKPAVASMPQPEAYPTPAATTGPVSWGASTIRLQATRHNLYWFNSSGQLTKQRTIQLARPRVWSTPVEQRSFNGERYAKLTSGGYSGWWVLARNVQGVSVSSFSTPQTLTVRAGKSLAKRFFNNTIARRVAYLATPQTYQSSRRATFNGTVHYLIDNGALAGRWLAAGRVIVGTTSQTPTATPTATPLATPKAAPQATWKTLVMLYRETDVTFQRLNGSNYRLQVRMTNEMYDLMRKTVLQFAKSANTWSGGLAAVDMKIVDMPHPVTKLEAFGGGYWVSPTAVKSDLNTYAPSGTYDSVIVIWQPTDTKGVSVPVPAWGLTMPDGSWSNNAGFSSIVTPHEMWWLTGSSAPEEVFVHEWMHQVIFFHERFKRTSIDLHAGGQYGYKDTNGSWKTWLMDVMQGKVKDGSKLIGISADTWKAGTPSAP
jgi:hypothetical protein